MSKSHQKLPSSGAAREALRQKGQFWTPAWVAEAMVAYAVGGGSRHIFDPAVGGGAFFRAAKTIAGETNRCFELFGCELDEDAIRQARESGLSESDLAGVRLADFVLQPPQREFSAIVANPPYIRHHRLSSETKGELRRLSISLTGRALDGRAGLHIYFLMRALQLLAPDGRLAFIMPADTCEGVFASSLWRWIGANFRLDAVVTFASAATPFPGVDTNAIIFFIRAAPPADYFLWARCSEANTPELKRWVSAEFEEASENLEVHHRTINEGLATGLSRAPLLPERESSDAPVLGDFARVLRGIATGANEFFFLTRRQAADLGITDEFLLPAIGRTRDVKGDTIDNDTLARLDAADKPTLLFSPDGRACDKYPKQIRDYLERGEAAGFHQRSLIATRRPWYKMEVRSVPEFVFAYLGRRNARFLRNVAGVVPLTGFLCVYPRRKDTEFVNELWRILRHQETNEGLSLVGKSYGGGAIKVEPRALERLPLPAHMVAASSTLAPLLALQHDTARKETQLHLIGI